MSANSGCWRYSRKENINCQCVYVLCVYDVRYRPLQYRYFISEHNISVVFRCSWFSSSFYSSLSLSLSPSSPSPSSKVNVFTNQLYKYVRSRRASVCATRNKGYNIIMNTHNSTWYHWIRWVTTMDIRAGNDIFKMILNAIARVY